MKERTAARVTTRRELLALLAIVVAFVVTLGRTVDHEYVWDDVPEIAANPAFDGPLLEGLAMTQVERGAPDLAHLDAIAFTYDSYRPLVFASLWLDVQLWGRGAGPMHRTNVMLGAVAIVLAYVLARQWLRGPHALAPTALFALHPIQVETTAYVSARGDLLAGLWALAATCLAIKALDVSRRRAAWIVGSCLAFAASLLSKEAYIGLPIAIAALACVRPGSRAIGWVTGCLAAVAVAYIPFRAAMIEVDGGPSVVPALLTLPSALADYVQTFALPFDLSIERTPERGPLALVLGYAGVLAVAGLAITRRWTAWGTTLAGIVWFVVLLTPSLVIVYATNVAADRYAYLPALGLGIAVTGGATEVIRARPKLRLPLVIGAVLWTTMTLAVTWRQVSVWRGTSSLYAHALEMEPDSSRAHYRVAVIDIQSNRWDLAITHLQRAIELDPTNVPALNNLGVYMLRHARAADAEHLLRRAVEANPARFNAWNNLGLAQLAQGQREDGCASIRRALALNPHYKPARAAEAKNCR